MSAKKSERGRQRETKRDRERQRQRTSLYNVYDYIPTLTYSHSRANVNTKNTRVTTKVKTWSLPVSGCKITFRTVSCSPVFVKNAGRIS